MTSTAASVLCISDLLESGVERLAGAGLEGARRDALLLLAAATGRERIWLLAHPEKAVGVRNRTAYDEFLVRRAKREPISRILGRREFWSLEFKLSSATLDPRPETETLVEVVIAHLRDRPGPVEILDLGTGSGCILLALLTELPQARGLGVDRSEKAVETARQNAETLGLADRASFRTGDWAKAITGRWQAIVSNPPYIVESEMRHLAPEVVDFDPHLALSGGWDGLEAYRSLLPQTAGLIASDGLLALEIGAGQAPAVTDLIEEAGFEVEDLVPDLGSVPRCLLATPVSRG